MSRVWQLQNAKARFAEVVRRASAEGPQIVTYRGVEKAVVLSIEEFRRLESNRPSFVQHLLSVPKLDEQTIELINTRSQDVRTGSRVVSFLLDTTVIAETTRKTPDPKVLAWFKQADPRDLYISVLSLGELAKGVAMRARHNKAQADALHDWLDATRLNFADRIIVIDAEIAEAWGELAAVRALPVVDGLLAATALIRGLTLVTRDGRDIASAGVPVINPWER